MLIDRFFRARRAVDNCLTRTRFLAVALLVAGSLVSGPSLAGDRFPGKKWDRAESPESAGWSSAKLRVAEDYADTIDTAAVMIVHNGTVVYEWGETDRVYRIHSIRKSLLSALYGIYVAEGAIQLDSTMADLGIDDNQPSLTETEKTATVSDLLKSRSGIYHAALYESASSIASKPARGSHAPGTFWLYNNWDFNALGTIFEQTAGTSLYEKFETLIAEPLKMQDFVRERHTRYFTGDLSIHPAYPFRLSARDLARFGLLFAREGRWKNKQIVPKEWVAESTRSWSKTQDTGGYGYMWWVADNGRHLPGVAVPDGTYSAQGANGHYVLVFPMWDLVVVHRVNTYVGDRVYAEEFSGLLHRILEARPSELTSEVDIGITDEESTSE